MTSLMTLSILMLMSWSAIKPAILRMISPSHQAVTEHVLVTVGEQLGAYVRAKTNISTIVGIWMYVTLTLLGFPIALLIAILTGLLGVIPRIGPLMARHLLLLRSCHWVGGQL